MKSGCQSLEMDSTPQWTYRKSGGSGTISVAEHPSPLHQLANIDSCRERRSIKLFLLPERIRSLLATFDYGNIGYDTFRVEIKKVVSTIRVDGTYPSIKPITQNTSSQGIQAYTTTLLTLRLALL